MSRKLEYLRDLILVLTQKEIKVRYSRNWLGYLWSVANPLAFALLYFVAFGVFMKVQIQNYVVFLLAGLFPWQWMSNAIGVAPNIFVSNASLLKKVTFPRDILVVSSVLNEGAHFLATIPVLVIFLAYYRVPLSWSWLLGIPLLALAQLLALYGVALGIASLNLFFRDLERLTAVALMFIFFLSPIAYSETMVPARYHALLYFNPVSALILSWRDLFIAGRLDWGMIALAYVYAALFAFVGAALYGRLSWKFAEVV